jgi:hypothetical protein
MSGYAGYSMSNNAVRAYNDYKMPISELRKFLGIKDVSFGECEWHHCSKFYNTVNFYDARDAIKRDDIHKYSNAKPNALQLYNRYLVKCVIVDESIKYNFRTPKMAKRFEMLSIAADAFIAAKNDKRAAARAKKEANKRAAAEELNRKYIEQRQSARKINIVNCCEKNKITAQKITDAFAGVELENKCGIYSQIRSWFNGMTLEESLKFAIK